VIDAITVRNFQSLESVTLELGGVTAVVGQTDSGKSSFLRAVQAALFNDSVYDSATVKQDKVAPEIQVEFTLDSGHTVLWRRTKTTAFYELLTSEGMSHSFTKLGRGVVPDDIQKLLGIREIQIDETNDFRLQFAEQHDAPFLVGDRGGVGATRLLGRLSGVFVLSNANKLAQSDKQHATGELDNISARQTTLLEDLGNYEGLEMRKAQIDEALHKAKVLVERQNRLREMVRIRASAAGVEHERQVTAYDPKMDDAIDSWDHTLQTIWPKLGRFERKVQLSTYSIKLQADIESAKEVASQVELVANFQVRDTDHLDKVKDLHGKLVGALITLKDNKFKLDAYGGELDRAEEELSKMDAQFPLCPFKPQFKDQEGVYRCQDLMKAINE